MLIMQHIRLKLFPNLKILKKYYKKSTYFLRFCFLSLYVRFRRILSRSMIENYKGWNITLTWEDNDAFSKNISKNNPYNQKEKWKGVHLNGKRIYGASLKEIRHIIDYPNLHKN